VLRVAVRMPRPEAREEPAGIPLAPGEVLLPPGYEALTELGRGGMGVVYKARTLNRGTLVAVKTIHAAAHASRRDVDRFLREVRVLKELRHPRVVAFHDF